jgi:hypothetical protein
MLWKGMTGAALMTIVIALAIPARGCNAMSGSAGCDGPYGYLPGYRDGPSGSTRGSGALPSMSTLGGDLSGSFERPGTIGAVTFGSGGRKCSGMFRSVNC